MVACFVFSGQGVSFNSKGSLAFVNLVDQKITYQQNFPCAATPLAISNNTETPQVAVGQPYVSKDTGNLKSNLLIIDFNKPAQRVKYTPDCQGKISALAYLPDDSYLLVACDEGTLLFLNPEDGSETYRLEGYPYVTSVAFSPDNKKMAMVFGQDIISIFGLVP